MANESLISIPANIDDTIVLRRVLTRIVEQLDTISGSRTGSANAYVKQSDLTSRLSDIQTAVTAAEKAAGVVSLSFDEVSVLVQQLEDSVGDIGTTISDLTSDLAAAVARISALESAGYITDAPSDGNTYARRNGAWVIV